MRIDTHSTPVLATGQSLEIRYYPAGKGWWGYYLYRGSRLIGGAELRTRQAAVKDAQATVRQMTASELPS